MVLKKQGVKIALFVINPNSLNGILESTNWHFSFLIPLNFRYRKSLRK